MDRLRIKGGQPLHGEIVISGSKNASLPLMVAALLSDRKLTLHNVPRLADIDTMIQLLQQHGGDVSFSDAGISASNEEHERELPHVLKRVCDVQRSYLGILGSGTSATSLRMMSSVSIPSA